MSDADDDASGLLPDWEVFNRDYVSTGVPFLFVVRPEPLVAIFIEERAARLGARFRLTDAADLHFARHLEEIHVTEVTMDGKRHLEVLTGSQNLYPNFFRLVSEVVKAVVDDGIGPVRALATAVARWEELLSRPAMLSEEHQTGLFGELWMLSRLIEVIGETAVQSWVGPAGHAHDFRVGSTEFEVKTTSGASRIHTINGEAQLQPSLGCSLHLLSLQLTDAGSGGQTLEQAVETVAKALSAWPDAIDCYRRALADVGYRLADAHLYSRRRRLRDAALLVPVVDGTPRLTREAMAGLAPRFAAERLVHVTYDIDVSGLGVRDGTSEFHSILPSSEARRPENNV